MEIIDHFVTLLGQSVDIQDSDREQYLGLTEDRKLTADSQPSVTYVSELPSVDGNANLFIDIAHAMFD